MATMTEMDALAIVNNDASTAEQLAACAGITDKLDRLLAKHPSAGAALLENLSHASDKATRKAVCLNPNTPKETLIRLAPQFPGEFFANPAFDWWLLEDPDLFARIGGGVLKNLAKRPECPASILNWAAAHGSAAEKLAVAMNPEAPLEALQKLVADGGEAAGAARQHARYRGDSAEPEMDLEVLFRREVEHLIAQSRTAPTPAQWPVLTPIDRLLATLGDDPAILAKLYDSLAFHAPPAWSALIDPGGPSTPLGDWQPAARLPVSAADDEAAAALSRLATNEAIPVRRAVARHPAAPAGVLLELAKDPAPEVRIAVARNPHTPPEALAELAKDKADPVRRAVTRNPVAPEALAAGNDAFAKHWIKAQNARKKLTATKATDADKWLDTWFTCLKSNPEVAIEYVFDVISGSVPAAAPVIEWLQLEIGRILEAPRTSRYWTRPRSTTRDTDLRLACERDDTLFLDDKQAAKATMSKRPELRVLGLAHRLVTPEALAKRSRTELWVERLAIARNPKTPANIIKKLSQDPHRDVTRQAKLTADRKADAEAKLKRLADPAVSLETLAELAADETALIRHTVAQHPAAPGEVLRRLAQDADKEVRLAVAGNPATPSALLSLQVKDEHETVRLAVAQHSATPVEAMRELATDPFEEVRLALTHNPAAPEEILIVLASDESEKIRLTIARSPTAPLQALLKQADCASRKVRCALAENQNAPVQSLIRLAKDEDNYVQRMVAANPRTPVEVLVELAKHKKEFVRESAAENPAMPVPQLFELATDPDEGVRIAVSANHATPPNLLVVLADSPANQSSVAGNPSAPGELLAKLARKENEWTRYFVAANYATPNTVLAELAKDGSERVRTNVADNPLGPAHLLSELAKDQSVRVRQSVALNPRTPANTLSELAQDEDFDVRTFAGRTWQFLRRAD